MSYEVILIVCVGAGLIGLALLLAHLSEIVWYLQRMDDDPAIILTDTAFFALLWMLAFGGLLMSEWMLGWPEDDRVANVFLAIGFAVIPWFLLVRWVRWRYWEE